MKKIFIIGIMCVMGAMGAKAQFDETNNLFYHLVRTPQSNYLNPAFYPIKTTFYINLPGTELQFGSPLASPLRPPSSTWIIYCRASARKTSSVWEPT